MFDYVTTADHVSQANYNWAAIKTPCGRVITLNSISNTGNCVGTRLTACKHDCIPHVSDTQRETEQKATHASCVSHSHDADLTAAALHG